MKDCIGVNCTLIICEEKNYSLNSKITALLNSSIDLCVQVVTTSN